MSRIPNNDDGLNDADFANLFASDNRQPPNELDKLILDNALLSQNDSIAQQHPTFIQKYAPLFGTAAVLMIAFALTPLIINTPESVSTVASVYSTKPVSDMSVEALATLDATQETVSQPLSGTTYGRR